MFLNLCLKVKFSNVFNIFRHPREFFFKVTEETPSGGFRNILFFPGTHWFLRQRVIDNKFV